MYSKIKKKFFSLVFIMLVFFINACSSFDNVNSITELNKSTFFSSSDCSVKIGRDDLAEVEAELGNKPWIQSSDGITIRVTAPVDLNLYKSVPNAVVIGFYQLSNPSVLVREVSNKTGIRKILLLKDLDPSILSYDSRSVQPRSSTNFVMDRVESAKYLGIVVGYYNLLTPKITRIIKFPLVRNQRSKLNPVNWLTKPDDAFAPNLDILVQLGKDQIEDVAVNIENVCEAV